MRSELFRIAFAGSVSIGLWQVPVFGFGVVLAAWCLIGGIILVVRLRRGETLRFSSGVVLWAVIAAAIVAAPWAVKAGMLPASWPVFGFGLMLCVGFFSAAQLAAWRFRRHGLDPEMGWDIAFWGVPAGILGARIFHVIQFWPQFAPQPIPRVFQLWDGGLVFYGGLIAGLVAYYLVCRVRKVDPLEAGDLLVPSLFVGLGFGRLGCFLNGCCYGDFCSLPWAVSFPPGSHPVRVQTEFGYLGSTDSWSLPLHPTQLYSALDAFLLAALTLAYYRFRVRRGDVIVLGLAGHAVTRFLIEFLRNDEKGQWGTALTISQWVSILMFVGALVFFWANRNTEKGLGVRGQGSGVRIG